MLAVTAVACADRASRATPAADSSGMVRTAAASALVEVLGAAVPFDDALRDASLTAFRDSLLTMIRARDSLALFKVLDPDIKCSFGGDDGVAACRALWRLGDPHAPMWGRFEDVLRHGGRSRTPDDFTAPYTFSSAPDSLDAFSVLVVRDSLVEVHAAPRADSPVVARVGDVIVRGVGAPPDVPEGWVAIALVGGGTGYVAEEHVRSPIALRIGMARAAGRWRIQYVVEGD